MSAIARWNLPSIGADAATASASALPNRPTQSPAQAAMSQTPPTVMQLEAIERNAHEDAFARGHAEGLAAAEQQLKSLRHDLQQQLHCVGGMLDALSRPLDQLDEEVEHQLMTLALSVAQQLVRRELRIDPPQVIAIIRATVALLPAATREVCVHLHPLDAALLRDALVTPDQAPAWQVREDPVLSRGDCRVSSASTQIDARLKTRLQAVASAILGDVRNVPERGSQQGMGAALLEAGPELERVHDGEPTT